LEKELLAVGDSTILEIILSTKKYRNRLLKKPRIQTNEGPPDKSVQVSANVILRPDSTYPLIISPYKIDMSQFTEKVIDKAKFKITNVSDQKLNLDLISYSDDIMEIKLPKEIKPGKTEKGEIKLKSDKITESFYKSFTLELNDEKKTRFTIPVKRTVKDMTKSPSLSKKGQK